MSIEDGTTEHLFTYGTLQLESVQLATFGRKLTGKEDALRGYQLTVIEVQDQEFVKKHGAQQRNLQRTGNASDFVEGMVFDVTKEELEHADAYEPVDYERISIELKSGTKAWGYLAKSS